MFMVWFKGCIMESSGQSNISWSIIMSKILKIHSFIYSRNMPGSVLQSWDIAVFKSKVHSCETHILLGDTKHQVVLSAKRKITMGNYNGWGREWCGLLNRAVGEVNVRRWHLSRGLSEVWEEGLQSVFKSP